MRVVLLLLGVLLLSGWAACVAPHSDAEAVKRQLLADPWRRTVDGWELSSQWYQTSRAVPPAPHPVVITLWQVLLAAMIGVGSSSNGPVLRPPTGMNAVKEAVPKP